MQYYNSRGELVEFNGLKSGHYGHNSEIMRLSDGNVYKRYFNEAEEENHISLEVFEFIKQLSNGHMVKLIERFYEIGNGIDSKDIRENPERHIIDAYTYEWVCQDETNLMDVPVDYLIDNLNELLLLADYFSVFGLYMMDVMVDNAVLNEKGVVLIDPDIYTFEDPVFYKNFRIIDDNFRVRKWNRRCVVVLFKAFCYKTLEKDYEYKDMIPVISNLFEEPNWMGEYDASIVSEKLKKFKRTREYIKAVIR